MSLLKNKFNYEELIACAKGKLAGIDFDDKGEMDHDHEEESPCDQGDEVEGGEEGPVIVSLKPKSPDQYNPVGGDKKEILNALMNRYKSL